MKPALENDVEWSPKP